MSKIYEVHCEQPHKIRRVFTTDIPSNGITPAHSVATIVSSFDGSLRGEHIVGESTEDMMKKLKARITQGGLQGFSLVEVALDNLGDLYPLTE